MSADLRAPDCKVFVNAEVAEADLIGLIAPVLFLREDDVSLQVEVVPNEDYDPARSRHFPVGFVYFRYLLDLYMPDATIERKATITTRLLNRLWDWGYPAVAACAYEDRLPERGGYKSRAVPWV